MKDTAWYTKLWQKKMLELPAEGDANAAWQKMQGLLDNHMPVNAPAPRTPKPGKFGGSHFLSIAAVITTTALLYYAGTHMFKGHKHKVNKDTVEQIKPAIDSIKNAALYADSNLAKDSTSVSKQNNNNNQVPIAADTGENHKTISGNIPGETKINGVKTTAHNSNKPVHVNAKKQSDAGLQQKNAVEFTSRKKRGNDKHSKKITLYTPAQTGKRQRQAVNVNALKSIKDTNDIKKNNPVSAPLVASSTSGFNNVLAAVKQPNTSSGIITGPVNKADSLKTTVKRADPAKNKAAANNSKSKPVKSPSKPKKVKPARQNNNAHFELDIKIGANSNGSFTASNQNNNFYGKSSVDAFLGISGAYYINKELSVGIGINVLSPKTISGRYVNNNYQYITLNDTGKKYIHNTGKITVSGTRKIYTVDIPIIATYKINNNISLFAGPVISIPVKQTTLKTTLSPLTSTSDTTVAPKVAPYVTNTTLNNKMNMSITGGIRLNANRFFIDAGYTRALSPYTISSGLGSGKIYYQTVQFGIGYKLFKPKGK